MRLSPLQIKWLRVVLDHLNLRLDLDHPTAHHSPRGHCGLQNHRSPPHIQKTVAVVDMKSLNYYTVKKHTIKSYIESLLYIANQLEKQNNALL